MTFDKFTIKAQEAVQEAVNTAQHAGQQAIEPVHLLQGILLKSRDVTNFIFQKLGVNAMQIEKLVQEELKHLHAWKVGNPISPTTLTKCWSVPSQTRRRWATSSSAWSPSSWLYWR